MSGLGNIPGVQVPQVQVPNYNGIGSLIAQSGTNLAGLGSGISQGMQSLVQQRQQAAANAMQQQQINIQQQQANQQGQQQAAQTALLQQQAAQQAQTQPLQVQSAQIAAAQQKQSFLADMAFGITQQPADKQEDAYKRVVGGLAQQGVISPNQLPPQWDNGGKDFVQQMASQSPIGFQRMQMQMNMQKDQADIALKGAQAHSSQITSAVNAQQAGIDSTTGIPTGTGGIGKPLTSADAHTLDSATATLNNIQAMRSQIQNGSPADWLLAKLPAGGGDTAAQTINTLQDSLGTSVGTMIGSNRLSEQQQKMAMDLIPGATDTQATKLDKLNRLEMMAQNVSKAIRPVGNTQPGVDPAYQAAAAQYPGLTQQQYSAILKNR